MDKLFECYFHYLEALFAGVKKVVITTPPDAATQRKPPDHQEETNWKEAPGGVVKRILFLNYKATGRATGMLTTLYYSTISILPVGFLPVCA